MNKELINSLKTNEKPHRIFADMSPEEQECLVKKVGPVNGEWLDINLVWKPKHDGIYDLTGIYRIKSSYQPETVDLEIGNV